MKKSVFGYIFWCIIPTIILFLTHDWMCKYDMNALCYIKCVFPCILGAPLLMYDAF
jgi:hypothetical protein